MLIKLSSVICCVYMAFATLSKLASMWSEDQKLKKIETGGTKNMFLK
jgi:hypothetical protein